MKECIYLYVEDDPLSREIMKFIMEMGMGITTLTIFSDSTDFAERLKGLVPRPDVILLDIHVQPYNGFAMLKMIQADPNFADCRVVALTASVMNEEVEQLRVNGFHGAIAKPLSVQTFPDLLKRVIAGEDIWHIA